MKQDWPSLTAHRVAMMRAAHQLLDNPKVFEDPIALRIVGSQGESDIRSVKLITDLKAIGFTQVEDFGPEEINARFFNDREDKLMVGNLGHLMKAQL